MSELQFANKVGQENFPVASRLLPRERRVRLLAVYGFARLVDDIGDEAEPAKRPAMLDEVEADLRRVYDHETPRLPVIGALAPVIGACGIPADPFVGLIEANRRDQVVTRYETFDELMGYCELSANPVGRIVLYVFDAARPDRFDLSDRVCSALQVIEHCQDVGEDYSRGRVYLPAEDLRRFGCTEDDLAGSVTPDGLRRVVAAQTGRAAGLLEEGAPLVGTLTGFARLAVAGYVAGGRATVAALDGCGHDVLTRTPRSRTTRLLREWLRTLARGR